MSEVLRIKRSDPQVSVLMESGLSLQHPRSRCVPIAIQNEGKESWIVFQAIPESVYSPKSPVQYLGFWLRSIRAVSLTATISPMVLVLLVGIVEWSSPRWLVGGLAVLGAALLQSATNVLNDVEDYKRWIDLPGGHGGSGVLQKAWLRVRDLRALATVCVVLALLAGLPALLTDWKIGVFVGLIGIIGAIGYSSKPLGLKYLALGDLAVFFLCGPLLTIGASLAFFSELRFEFHVLGFAFGLLACAILHANNLQDIDADRASGATTLAGILGFGPSRILLALFYIGAWIALGILGFHLIDSRWTQLLSFTPMLLPLFLTLKLMSTVYSASGTASPLLNLIRIRAAQLHMIYALALAASLLLYQGLFV